MFVPIYFSSEESKSSDESSDDIKFVSVSMILLHGYYDVCIMDYWLSYVNLNCRNLRSLGTI